jgi:hypothetical protein
MSRLVTRERKCGMRTRAHNVTHDDGRIVTVLLFVMLTAMSGWLVACPDPTWRREGCGCTSNGGGPYDSQWDCELAVRGDHACYPCGSEEGGVACPDGQICCMGNGASWATCKVPSTNPNWPCGSGSKWECTSDLDCAIGDVCCSNRNVPGGFGASCKKNADCPKRLEDETCGRDIFGGCYSASCLDDGQPGQCVDHSSGGPGICSCKAFADWPG